MIFHKTKGNEVNKKLLKQGTTTSTTIQQQQQQQQQKVNTQEEELVWGKGKGLVRTVWRKTRTAYGMRIRDVEGFVVVVVVFVVLFL